MRWEYTQPIYEVADRQVNINTYTGKLLYAGKDGNSRALYDPYYKQFKPRIGIAWNPISKLVFRTGYAISTLHGRHRREPASAAEPAVLPRVERQLRRPQRRRHRARLLRCVGHRVPRRARTGAAPFYQGRAWDQQLRPQFTQQYNAALEYQFSTSTSMTVAYVGQLGTHLVVPHEANNPVAGRRAGSDLDQRRTIGVRWRSRCPTSATSR